MDFFDPVLLAMYQSMLHVSIAVTFTDGTTGTLKLSGVELTN